MRTRVFLLSSGALCSMISVSTAFSSASSLSRPCSKGLTQQYNSHGDVIAATKPTALGSSNLPQEESESSLITCWNPKLRKAMGLIAGAGVAETAYLTISKFTDSPVSTALCGTEGSCTSVLNGPYAFIPGTGIPLSLLGLIAYSLVGYLAVAPLLPGSDMSKDEETNNRMQLTAVATAMGVFSVFLMTLLFGVLKESCPYCIASACFSITLAKLAWIGGAVPSERIKQGIKMSAGGGIASFLAFVIFFSTVPETSLAESSGSPFVFGDNTELVASSSVDTTNNVKTPPPVLSSSSPRALTIAKDLQSLDARMFGAYWCSHCYDQKERLGKEAMNVIPYIECSREGFESKNSLCKEREVPGYPTWEINGKLYPGEQELDELEDIIKEIRAI